MFKNALMAAYAAAGVLTFGHVFNDNYVEPTPIAECGSKPDISKDGLGWNKWWDCVHPSSLDTSYFHAGFPAVYAGLLWPAYWAGHYAIKVTK